MLEREITVQTPDGPMKCCVVQPEGAGPFSIVLQFMDAGGLRDELKEMARRYSEVGVMVVTPDLFHRFGEQVGFEPRVAFAAGGDAYRAKMLATLGRLSDDMIMTDVTALLEHLESDEAAGDGPKGCVGYCLGGRAVVRTMAAFSNEMVAGSALHPSHLLNDTPGSAHLDISEIKGEMYFGFGGQDALTPAPVITAVREKLAEGDVANVVDITPDADHGFTMRGWPERYNPDADALHWKRTLGLFDRRLATTQT